MSSNKQGKLLNDEALPIQDAFNGVDLNFRIWDQMKHHNKIKSLHVKSDANIDNDYKRNYTSQKDKRTLEDGVLFIAIPFVGGKNGEFGKYIGYSIKFPGYTPFAEDTPTFVNETI